MSLRIKLILPGLIVIAALVCLIHFVWLPRYMEFEYRDQLDMEQSYLKLLSTALIPNLLYNDFAPVFNTLRQAEEERSDLHSIVLTDVDKVRIYPLAEPDRNMFPQLFTVEQAIVFEGKSMGYLRAYVDLGYAYEYEIGQVILLEEVLLGIFVFIGLAALFLQNYWILQPLDIIRQGMQKLAQGNHTTSLSCKLGADEVGQVGRALLDLQQHVSEREQLFQYNARLYELVLHVQEHFISQQSSQPVLRKVLNGLLDITDSSFGFIAESFVDEDHGKALKTLVANNIRWNSDDEVDPYGGGLRIGPFTGLYSTVLSSREVLLCNHPREYQCDHPLPEGHPPVSTLAILPLLCSEQMMGVLVLGNRKGGYQELMLTHIQVLLRAMANYLVTTNTNKELKESESRFRAVLDTAVDGIIRIDARGRVRGFNGAAERIFGYSQEEMLGTNVSRLMPEPTCNEHDQYLQHYQQTGEAKVIGIGREVVARCKDGTMVDLELAVSEVMTANGPEYTGILRDITERNTIQKALADMNERLERMVRTDALTQMANRKHFNDTLELEFKRAMRNQSAISLILCDIDFFKNYNEHYGHLAGDACLQHVADILAASFQRAGDTIARYGGEEFAIVLPGVGTRQADLMGEQLRKAVWEACLEHQFSEVAARVTISVGVSTCTPRVKDAAQLLVTQADLALNEAKKGGRNTCRHYQKPDSPIKSP